MENKLGEEFADLIQGNNIQFGYIVPGHGMKGKQRPIESPEDLTMMSNEYKGKRCILLWMKCQKPKATKRQRSTSTEAIASSECIQQLDQWHQLKQKGAITSAQYEMQEAIIRDIKKC